MLPPVPLRSGQVECLDVVYMLKPPILPPITRSGPRGSLKKQTEAKYVRAEDPRRATVTRLTRLWASRRFLSVAFMAKPPILALLRSGPRKASPKGIREGGKVREEAGPTPGPLGSRNDRFLFDANLD